MKCFVVALFKIISRHFYGDSEKYHEEILKIQLGGADNRTGHHQGNSKNNYCFS